MDSCLQNEFPKIAKALDKEYVEGECCATQRNEQYLDERAEMHFYYRDYCASIFNLRQSIQHSHISNPYIKALETLLLMIHDNYNHFKLDEYDHVYVLFGFYCPLHLQNSCRHGNTNLLIYIVVDPQNSNWNTMCSWSGINNIKKYLGYNNYLPYDQY